MGDISMTILNFKYIENLLPDSSEDQISVLMYALPKVENHAIAYIGNPIWADLAQINLSISKIAFDFLNIALAVTAADTFVLRKNAEDGWTRHLRIKLPLSEPSVWETVRNDLEKALHFLSGDIWEFEFSSGFMGYKVNQEKRNRAKEYHDLNCISLFSGGLDSAIGAIDLLSQGRKPLFVSHSYKGDKSKQEQIIGMLRGTFGQLSLNADPHHYKRSTEISMRTRSLNFLAFGVIGASIISNIHNFTSVDLIVPENGFISLNVPLTPRRIGSLSTRTTHPYFIGIIQQIFDRVGIGCRITNPYQFKTKGEMASSCSDKDTLQKIVDYTVSCSHWKRKNQQCGVCVPCLIRQAALFKSKIIEKVPYELYPKKALSIPKRRDDLFAMIIGLSHTDVTKSSHKVILNGPLPKGRLADFSDMYLDGIEEMKEYFVHLKIL